MRDRVVEAKHLKTGMTVRDRGVKVQIVSAEKITRKGYPAIRMTTTENKTYHLRPNRKVAVTTKGK